MNLLNRLKETFEENPKTKMTIEITYLDTNNTVFSELAT